MRTLIEPTGSVAPRRVRNGPGHSRRLRSVTAEPHPQSAVRVTVIVRQVVLVHVRVRVLGSLAVRVRVFMLEVVMVVAGVRMRVGEFVVTVFVGVGSVVPVLIVCHCRLLAMRNSGWRPLCSSLTQGQRCRTGSWASTPRGLRRREW